MCSTFKWLIAAAVLQRVDAGQEDLVRIVAVPRAGILSNSPVTQEHAGRGMTIRELAAAIVTRSDNTGANLLLETIGGPAGLTRFARSIGDNITRLDSPHPLVSSSPRGWWPIKPGTSDCARVCPRVGG
jgi:beta-lactamase class A